MKLIFATLSWNQRGLNLAMTINLPTLARIEIGYDQYKNSTIFKRVEGRS